jgi:flavodoxin
MKALVVYDSVYGNTEKIARAIGDALKPQADVRTLRIGEAKPEHMAGLGLLVVGSPTQGSMTSPAMKAWLKALASSSLRGVKVAAFDTRMAESLHGAGSPQAQRIMLARLADLEEKMRLARRLAGTPERPLQ